MQVLYENWPLFWFYLVVVVKAVKAMRLLGRRTKIAHLLQNYATKFWSRNSTVHSNYIDLIKLNDNYFKLDFCHHKFKSIFLVGRD